MKTWLIDCCLVMAEWLGWTPPTFERVPSIAPAYIARAGELTSTVNPALGGEAKRHQVYARLIKDFPDAPKRELSLAIELALFQSPKEG